MDKADEEMVDAGVTMPSGRDGCDACPANNGGNKVAVGTAVGTVPDVPTEGALKTLGIAGGAALGNGEETARPRPYTEP